MLFTLFSAEEKKLKAAQEISESLLGINIINILSDFPWKCIGLWIFFCQQTELA